MPTIGLFQNIGTMELLIILGIALLIFGRRLPEVGRSLGRGIVEFRKGIKGIEDEIDDETKPGKSPDRQKLSSSRPTQPLSGSGADVRVSRADAVEPGTPESGGV